MTNEEAIKELEGLAKYFDIHVPAIGGEALRMGAAALLNQRPHGKWKLIRCMADGAEMKCSVCGRSYHFNSFFRAEYCLFCHCGAKWMWWKASNEIGILHFKEDTIMELIDKNEIYKFFNGGNGITRLHVSDVDVIPTIDATPVVHGRWVVRDKKDVQSLRFYLCDCSVCGYHTGTQAVNFNFCPKCGATMEKLGEDDIK